MKFATKVAKAKRLEAGLGEIQTLLSHLHGEITALEASYSDVLQALRKLEGAAETDDLTGLYRRRPFFQKWQNLLDACQKLNEDCGVILIDIDHFKKVNDTYGHPTGDEVIKGIASLLQKYQNPHCVVSRYGGEEFAIAVQGSEREITRLAERIREDAEGTRFLVKGSSSGVELCCTLSVGVASSSHQGYDAPRLLQSADDALYDAKHSGRNRVKIAA